MKRTRIAAAAAVLMMLVMLCSCGSADGAVGGILPSINGQKEQGTEQTTQNPGGSTLDRKNTAPTAAGQYSTIYEQSELRWYIAQKYGGSAVDKYCFYDLDDQSEASFVLAARYSDGSGPELLVRSFNKGLGDWYEYNNDIYVSSSSEEYGDTEYGGTQYRIYRIVLDADRDTRNEYASDVDRIYAYVTYNKTGLLDRIFIGYEEEDLSYGVAGRYEYDASGAVSVYGGYEWDVSYSDFFMNADWQPYWAYSYRYEYTKDGLLTRAEVTVTQTSDTEDTWTDSVWTFEYDGSGRAKTEFCEYFGADTEYTTMDCVRDAKGLVTSLTTHEERYDDERRYTLTYEQGGLCVYTPVWE